MQTPHPTLPPLDDQHLAGLPEPDALALLRERETLIANEKRDPFRYVWIGPIWQILIAALDLNVPRLPDPRRALIKARLQHLAAAAGVTLPASFRAGSLLGANRSGKSYLAAWLINQVLARTGLNTACYQYNEATSVETQQAATFAMLPLELKPEGRKLKHAGKGSISYSIATGFGTGNYVFPNGAMNVFRYYTQDTEAAEGTKYILVHQDENAPPKVRLNAFMRVSDSGGKLLSTITPKNGFTPLVRQMVEGAVTILSVPAFLLPLDGGPPDLDRALGFDGPEDRARHAAIGMPSRPYDLDRWLAGGSLTPAVPSGRTFATLPVLQVSTTEPNLILYNHLNNNPYANPPSVLEIIGTHDPERIRRLFYGYAESNVHTAFPMFKRSVHVVKATGIPAQGENIMVCDPGPGTRNYFIIWASVTPLGIFIYREWPGHYPVPGKGIPGAWAVPSDHPDRHDGDRGPASQSFGFGTLQYKREIARLEGWADYRDNLPSDGKNLREAITKWSPKNGAKEKVTRRIMDSRFGNSVITKDTGVQDYFSSYAEIGLHFEETAGTRADGRSETETGLGRLTELLEYDPTQPVDVHNRPQLFISEDCRNCIEALSVYTGADGQSGAWKDVIDVIRYLAQANIHYIDPKRMKASQGATL